MWLQSDLFATLADKAVSTVAPPPFLYPSWPGDGVAQLGVKDLLGFMITEEFLHFEPPRNARSSPFS